MKISFDALRDANCARLFFGQLISQACDKMMSVGLVWMFTERYPAVMIPWFLGVSALPHLLLAWHAGRWTTALGQLRTLVSTDIFRGVVFLLLTAVWPLVPPSSQLGLLFAGSFVANLASALFNPAMFSMPVVLADGSRLQQLTAMIDSCFSIGSIVGPALAALVYAGLGLRGLFLFNGLSYLLAAALEAGIRPRKRAAAAGAAPEGAPQSADRVTRILRSDRLVTVMLLGFLASNLFLAPLMVFLPLFVKARYHGAINTLALLEGVFGAGTVTGGLLLSAIKLDSRLGRNIALGMVAVAMTYVAFSLTGSPTTGAVCMAALGFSLALTNVFSMTLFQSRIAERNLPTFMSLVNLISVASLPLSMTAIGFLIKGFQVQTLAIVFSCALLAVTLAVVSNRKLRSATGS